MYSNRLGQRPTLQREIPGLLRKSGGNSLATFRDNLWVPSSRVKNRFFTLGDGTGRLSRNVVKELLLLSA